MASNDYHTKLFMSTIVLWGLWTARNKMGIEKIFPRNSNEIFHNFFVFLQKWRILLREQSAPYLDDKITRMKSWAAVFHSLAKGDNSSRSVTAHNQPEVTKATLVIHNASGPRTYTRQDSTHD